MSAPAGASLTAFGASARFGPCSASVKQRGRSKACMLRIFLWWFWMGALMTLAVLMIQGGVHELLYGPRASRTAEALMTFAMTIAGGGLLAGCLAVILNRLR